MGSRGPVEVPLGRLGRPVGRAAGRCDRDPGVRQSALRAERAPAASRRPLRSGGRRQAHERGRGPRPSPARSRRRQGQRGDLHGQGVPRLGRRPHGRGLRGAGEHPRLGRDGRRAGRDLRAEQRAAGGAPDRLPRGGPGRGRRQPRAAVLGAPRRPARRRLRGDVRHRSSSSASRTTSSRSRSCAASTRSTTRSSGRRRARSGSTSTTSWPRSYGSGSASSATTESSRTRSPAGPGRRTSRTALTVSSRSILSCSKL